MNQFTVAKLNDGTPVIQTVVNTTLSDLQAQLKPLQDQLESAQNGVIQDQNALAHDQALVASLQPQVDDLLAKIAALTPTSDITPATMPPTPTQTM